ncbi:hypothetical protein ACEOWJ_000410 [Bacillus cereus]
MYYFHGCSRKKLQCNDNNYKQPDSQDPIPKEHTHNHNVAQISDSGNSHVNLNVDSDIDSETASSNSQSNDVEQEQTQTQRPAQGQSNTDVTNQLLAALLPFLTNALNNATQPQQSNQSQNKNNLDE